MAAGELGRCNAGRLASVLHSVLYGSLLGWAIHGEGDLSEWLRRDLGTVPDPYRPNRAGRGRRPKP